MNIDKIIREEVRLLKEVTLDVNKLGDALADVESSGGDYTAETPRSSAAGKYQFLWNTWGKEIERVTGVSTKQEFLDSPLAQEKFFKYYVNNELKPQVAQLKSNSTKSDAALAALVHLQGFEGAKLYLKTGAETAPEINMPVEKYLDQVETAYYGAPQTTDIEQSTNSREKQDPNPEWKTILDYFQFGLDIAGIIPYYGDALDLVNAIIYVTRANVEDDDSYYIDAALSSIAIIPAVGSAIALPLKAMIKGLRKFPGGTKTLKKALKNVDDAESWGAVFSAARQNNLIDQNTLNVLSTKMRDVNKTIVSRTDKFSKQFGIPITLLQKPRKRIVGLLDAMAAGAAKERKIAAAAKTTKLDLPNWAKNIISAPIKLAKLSVLAPLKTLSGYRKVVGADTKSIVNVASNAFDNKFLFKGGFERFIETIAPGSGVAKLRTKLPDLLKKLNVDSYKSNMSPAEARKELSDLFRQYEKRSAKDRKNLVNDFNEWAKNTDVADGIQAQDYINALRKSYVSKQFGLGNLTRSNFIPTFKESFQRLKNSGGRALVENLNVFKIIPRLLRDAPVLSNSDNEIVASIGDMLGNMAYKLWESTGAIAILKSMESDSPGYDEQKEESKQAAKEFMQIKEEVIETVKQIPDSEYNELTEEEQKILQEILVFD